MEAPEVWITTEEYLAEWHRQRELRLPFDAPEVAALMERMGRRGDALFELYGRQLVDANQDKWIAISVDGQTLIRDHSWEAHRDGEATFGPGSFALRKLNHEFQCIMLLTPTSVRSGASRMTK